MNGCGAGWSRMHGIQVACRAGCRSHAGLSSRSSQDEPRNLRIPVVADESEFLVEVDFVHRPSPHTISGRVSFDFTEMATVARYLARPGGAERYVVTPTSFGMGLRSFSAAHATRASKMGRRRCAFLVPS